MNNENISKETIWAVSIIIVCVLSGCFLLIKPIIEKSAVTTLMASNEAIVLQENPGNTGGSVSISSAVSEEGNTSKSTQLFMDSENPDLESAKTFTETEIADISYDCPVDFEELWKTNEDVYAWITVPGTVIDYPILQHETDDSYYLNYTIDGIEGYPGCIYTENANSKDFTDNNTAIYGHNMRNGTMFTDLHKFRDEEFFNEHDTVYIYTPGKQLTYKIFAAYLYDDRHLINSFDFSDPEIYSDYLLEIQNMDSEDMNIRKEVAVTNSDKIITLITCIREQPEKRVYVQAVLLPTSRPTAF